MSSAFFKKACAATALAAWLAGCASTPPMPPAAGLFHDELFAAPSEPVDPAAALAVSAEMQRYVHDRLAGLSRFDDRKRQLFDSTDAIAALVADLDNLDRGEFFQFWQIIDQFLR